MEWRDTDMAKTKATFNIEPKLITEAECLLQQIGCSSKSEFFATAVEEYIAKLHLKNNENYFGNVITSTIDGKLEGLEKRLGSLEFKTAVMVATLVKMMAYENNWTEEQLDNVREECIEETRRLNGGIR